MAKLVDQRHDRVARGMPTSKEGLSAGSPLRSVGHGQRLDQTYQPPEGGNRCPIATTQHAWKKTTKTTICPADGRRSSRIWPPRLRSPTRLTELLA